MYSILNNQVVEFDTHQAGDGRAIDIEGLHMHKYMYKQKYKSVNVRIPFSMNQSIDYSGKLSKGQKIIVAEIKKVFNNNPTKVRELAIELAKQISKYAQYKDATASKKLLEQSAMSIASHLGLHPHISKALQEQVEKRVTFIITEHDGDNGKKYYIKQDIKNNRVVMSDNQSKLT